MHGADLSTPFILEFDPEDCPSDCSRPCENVCPANAISFERENSTMEVPFGSDQKAKPKVSFFHMIWFSVSISS